MVLSPERLAEVLAPIGRPRATAAAATVIVSNLPARVDLNLYQGDDFTLKLTVTNPDGSAADLTGAVATSQIRVSASSPTVAGSFVASIASNVVTLHLTGPISAALAGSNVWDVQIDRGGVIATLLAGAVTVTAEVTRP